MTGLNRSRACITISVEPGDPLDFQADVLALKYAQAPYGVDEAVVTRLNETGQGIIALHSNIGEYTLVKTHEQIAARYVLLMDVKYRDQYEYQDIRQSGYELLLSLEKAALKTKQVCLALPSPEYGLDEYESFQAEIAGLADAIRKGVGPEELEQITIVERNHARARRFRQLLCTLMPGARADIDSDGGRRIFGEPTTIRLLLAGRASVHRPRAFVAMPFDDDMHDTFYLGIDPAVRAAGYICERADLSILAGSVPEEIRKHIATAHLVIADLSRAKPNVYLELGYAWGCSKKPVLLRKEGEKLHFDVADQQCLTYDSDRQLKKSLHQRLKALKKQGIADSTKVRDAKEVISEIDRQRFAKRVSEMILEVSSGDETKSTKAHELMTLALRWAFLLDRHFETNIQMYLEEAENQLRTLYSLIPQDHRKEIISMETKVRKYFGIERVLQSRIQANHSFTGSEVRQYLHGKSGDALFYGRLLAAIAPEWSLTDELRTNSLLSDMVDDIADYEEDIKHKLPNLLRLYFSGHVERRRVPRHVEGALRLARELGVSGHILRLAARLEEKALASKDLNRSPTLRKIIVSNYDSLKTALEAS